LIPPTQLRIEGENHAQHGNGELGLVFTVNFTAPGSGSTELDYFEMIVYFSEEEASDRVCCAGKAVELRSEGCFRQGREDDVWGQLVPDGFLPTLPAGGIEGRQTRSIMIPSTGDFESLPDGATPVACSSHLQRDGYHFAREAAT
jgi:hypothetical protein